MIYLHTKFHMLGLSGSSDIGSKFKVKQCLCDYHIFISTIYKIITVTHITYFSKIYYHI